MLADMVQDHDEAILKHLQDIKVKFSQSNPMVGQVMCHKLIIRPLYEEPEMWIWD